MADYIYLLRTRLTPAQQTALEHVREAARAHGITIFLVGGAVRDLTSGSPIRDLDVVVQGNALKLRKEIQKSGGVLVGENEQGQLLHFNFPGGVRLEVGSALSATYPKPGKPVYRPAGILDDLRRRDFTANAMAISLNEGSYGLLMDPLNGVADIDNRELRLVSNYGFIEDPIRMVRAARFAARLGWQMEEKTQQRYETGKAENYIQASTPAQRGYELEEIFHEEDPLRVLRRLEAEGWAKVLFPAWTSAKANEAELERLRDTVGQMEAMGIHPDPSPAYFPLLTAKLNPKDAAALKASFARPGFAEQIAALEPATKAFATQLSGKAAAAPSDAWKMLFSSPPEPVLWLAHSTKNAALQAKFKAFFEDWSQARQKIPYQLMQEMRIHPDLPGYQELLETLFFAIMDAKLETPEAAKAFLEPFSPPAPPPPVNLRRRAVKRETKAAKPRAKKGVGGETPELAANGAAAQTGAPESAPAVKTAPAKSAGSKSTPAKSAGTSPSATASPAKAASPAAAKGAPTKGASAKAAAGQAAVGKPGVGKSAAKQPAKVAAKSPVKNGGKAAAAKGATKPAPKPAAKKAPAKVASRGSSQGSSRPGGSKVLTGTSGAKKASGNANGAAGSAKKTAAKPIASARKPVKAASKASAQEKKAAGKKAAAKVNAATRPKASSGGKGTNSKPKPKAKRR